MRPLNRFSVGVLFLAVILNAARGENISSNIQEQARLSVAVAVNAAVEAGTMRDMAVMALKNVNTAVNDADESFLAAVKSGDRGKQLAAKKSLDQMLASAEEARLILIKISDDVAEASSSAELAKELEKNLSSAKSTRDAESLVRKIERSAEAGGKMARKAQALAEGLKKQWLLPVSVPRATGTNAVETVGRPAAGR